MSVQRQARPGAGTRSHANLFFRARPIRLIGNCAREHTI